MNYIRCSKCFRTKLSLFFYKDSNLKRGFRYSCKRCDKRTRFGIERGDKIYTTYIQRLRAARLQMQFCSHCKQKFPLVDFGKDKSKTSGFDKCCKTCKKDKKHEYYLTYPTANKDFYKKNKERILECGRKKDIEYLSEWINYFRNKYGDSIKCQICSIELYWFSGKQIMSVNFDHRHGKNVFCSNNKKESINAWIRRRPCNSTNIKMFESGDFGFLCLRCNSSLPTKNREEWVRKVNKYVFGD